MQYLPILGPSELASIAKEVHMLLLWLNISKYKSWYRIATHIENYTTSVSLALNPFLPNGPNGISSPNIVTLLASLLLLELVCSLSISSFETFPTTTLKSVLQ